jgi:hypothetical protein
MKGSRAVGRSRGQRASVVTGTQLDLPFPEDSRMARTNSSQGRKGPTTSQPGKQDLVKVKLTLGRETARLLRLEAFGRDVSLGQVVEDLVRSSPRRFVLVDRGVKGSQGIEGSDGSRHSTAQSPQGDARPLGLVSDAG